MSSVRRGFLRGRLLQKQAVRGGHAEDFIESSFEDSLKRNSSCARRRFSKVEINLARGPTRADGCCCCRCRCWCSAAAQMKRLSMFSTQTHSYMCRSVFQAPSSSHPFPNFLSQSFLPFWLTALEPAISCRSLAGKLRGLVPTSFHPERALVIRSAEVRSSSKSGDMRTPRVRLEANNHIQ